MRQYGTAPRRREFPHVSDQLHDFRRAGDEHGFPAQQFVHPAERVLVTGPGTPIV